MSRKTFVIVIAALDVLIWCGVLAYDVRAPAVQANAGVPPVPAAWARIGAPARIRIPGIAVDAAIEKVGLAADKSMGVPKDPLNAAWFSLGPRPGETGSAVIAGHVNWFYGATGAFEHLHDVKTGDTIVVQDDVGASISFVVREIRTYDAAADATEVFSSHDGKAHLNLITCDGVWDKRDKQYSKRLVVFADREME